LRTNVKTVFTYPKTIWYSLRYNAGEKFILTNQELYPYKYDTNLTEEQNNEPVRVSTTLLVAAKELQLIEYLDEKIAKAKREEIKDYFLTSFNELYYINHLNKELDLPVAVFARILYAYVLIKDNNYDVNVDTATLDAIVDKFIKKVEFADAESISQVMHYLAYVKNTKVDWNILMAELKKKHFLPEFTKVTNSDPHVFRYVEVDNDDLKKTNFGEIGNKLYVLGLKPVFDAYKACKTVGDRINTSSAIKDLESRFKELSDKKYH
jgi:hypothetical protein